MKKLPFNLDTLVADRHFIPIYPENKQWLIVLKGTELGEKVCKLLEPKSKEETEVVGLWLDKIYGLYQEERQLLEQQIEDYYNEKLQFQKYVAKVAKALEVDNDKAIDLLDDPYKEGLEIGESLEPFLADFREIALKLTKLESRLNEDTISVVIAKRFKIDWNEGETKLLHDGMKNALSEFISNERIGWDSNKSNLNQDNLLSSDGGKTTDTKSQTGSASTTTSETGAAILDSTT